MSPRLYSVIAGRGVPFFLGYQAKPLRRAIFHNVAVAAGYR